MQNEHKPQDQVPLILPLPLCLLCSFSRKPRRTRYGCSDPECMLPLCTVGSGINDVDCFTHCHKNEVGRKAALLKYSKMKLTTNRRGKDNV